MRTRDRLGGYGDTFWWQRDPFSCPSVLEVLFLPVTSQYEMKKNTGKVQP